MALMKDEESIPNLSEFQLFCSTPLDGHKRQISEPQIIKEEINSHKILPEIYGEIPAYTAQSLKELKSSLMSASLNCESADMHETSHDISSSNSQNNLYDIQWRFHPNVWQMENITRCLDFQHLNSGNTEPVNNDNITGSPHVSNSLEEDISLCSSESTFSSTQIATERPHEREVDEESCKLYEEERMINANTQPKTMEDEILVPECLSNTGNFDLKCSSSIDQVSFRHTSEQNYDIQDLVKLGNNKLAHAGTTSSCTAQRNPVPPIQDTRVERSKQAMPSGGVVWSSHRVMESLVDHDDDTAEKEDVGTHSVDTNFDVENNNENHHKLLRIRNNCTKVTTFCNSQPVVVHQLDAFEGSSHSYGGEERQVAVVKEIKNGKHQSSDKTAIDISRDKHGRKKQTTEIKEAPVNTLALRKAYDEKQRAETRKHIHQTPKKEEYKECVCEKMSRNRSRRRRLHENVELPKIVSTEKVFKYKANKVANMPLKENLAIYNGPGRILVVKLESETCQQAFIDRMIHLDRLEKDDQSSTQPPQDESVDEYKDDFECDEKNDSALSSKEDECNQFQSTITVDQITHKQRAERQVRKENSYLEISRRLKTSLSSRNVLFTRQPNVCSGGGYAVTTSEMFHITSDTTPSNSSGTDSDDSCRKELVRFPSIQMNNFVSQRFPRNAFSQGRVGMFRNRQVREKAVEIYRRRSEQLHQPPPRYTHHVKLPKLPAIRRRQTPNNSFRESPSNRNTRRR